MRIMYSNTGWLNFRSLTSTRLAIAMFVAALLLTYGALPLFVNALFLPNQYFIELAQLTLLASFIIVIGYQVPLLDFRFKSNAARIRIEPSFFHSAVWISFVAFLLITFVTAEAIPIVSALKGADTAELSQQRGEFLKSRVGVEAALLYLSTFFVGALLPYSLAALYLQKSRYRFALTILFLAYSVSFLAKSLFINVMLPLIYVFAQRSRASAKRVLMISVASVLLLYTVTLLSFGGESVFETDSTISDNFFGARYTPTGAIDHLVWRSVAVPMFTAADTLSVFADQFNREPMWGATSSFLSAMFDLERIPLEKLVFAYQWGFNDIANSNSVYITEGFVNFKWFGVIFFTFCRSIDTLVSPLKG